MKKEKPFKKRRSFIGFLGSVQDRVAPPFAFFAWMKGEDYHIPVDSKKVIADSLEMRKLSEENKISRRKTNRRKGKEARKNRGKKR